jgi:hypothetical protein
MKLQQIAAALALVAAGTANAAMVGGGNGSIVLIAFDKLGGTTTSGMFDLGLTLDSFWGATGNGSGAAAGSLAATAGTNIVWDFKNNTIAVNGTVTTAYGATNAWTAAWDRLVANVDSADLQFVVTAFDTTGNGAAKRTLVTGVENPTAAQLNNSTSQASNLQQPALLQPRDIFTPASTRGTHATADNGANTFIAADGPATKLNGYAVAGDAFANNWVNNNLLNGETFATNAAALWVVDGLANERKALYTVRLDVANGQLIYGTPAVVPEPATYALAFAGLAIAGVAARRRRAA